MHYGIEPDGRALLHAGFSLSHFRSAGRSWNRYPDTISTMSLIAIIGQFDVHSEDVTAVGDLMRTMMNETQKEHGCLHYAFATDLSTPNRFQLSELWESDEALAAHFRTTHMVNFRAGLSSLRIEKRVVKRYDAGNPADL